MEFCDDLETDQVGTRNGNTRGVMGWGRGASEDLSRLYLFLCFMLKRKGVGAYNNSASFSHTHFFHTLTHAVFLNSSHQPCFHTIFLLWRLVLLFFVFALFTVVGAREEYSYRFHDAELFFLFLHFHSVLSSQTFFGLYLLFFNFSCCRRLSSLLFSIVHKRTCNPGYRTPLGCNNQTICTMR